MREAFENWWVSCDNHTMRLTSQATNICLWRCNTEVRFTPIAPCLGQTFSLQLGGLFDWNHPLKSDTCHATPHPPQKKERHVLLKCNDEREMQYFKRRHLSRNIYDQRLLHNVTSLLFITKQDCYGFLFTNDVGLCCKWRQCKKTGCHWS